MPTTTSALVDALPLTISTGWYIGNVNGLRTGGTSTRANYSKNVTSAPPTHGCGNLLKFTPSVRCFGLPAR